MKKTFTGHTRLFLCISGVLIVAALIMQICGVGMNLGIDFTGGSLLNYSVGEDFDVRDVETILNSAGYEGSQITKAAPSDASIELQRQLAETPAATEAPAEAHSADDGHDHGDAEVEAEVTVEPVETEAAAPLLDMDKSGIEADGMTDLQIRLKLVDETQGLEQAVADAVKAALPAATEADYRELTNSVIVNKSLDASYAGGYMAEFTVGEEFDAQAVTDTLQAALEDKYALESVIAMRYDAEAEAAAEAEAEATAEPAEDAADDSVDDATADTTDAEATDAAEAVETGDDLRVLVKIDDQASRVRDLLETQMTAKYSNFRFVSIDHVSAIAGRDLLGNAVKALLIAFACMLVYIAIRFDPFSGVAALLALVHDVLIMCAFMVFFRGVYQVNSSFIAAILTIVGYSINNTIIIFDRIRENAKKPGLSQATRMDIVETSVSTTLSRTINTSLTTMITLVTLYIFGVEAIREFAFPLIVGMLAGSYSSTLLSGQVWAMWMDRRAAKQATRKA